MTISHYKTDKNMFIVTYILYQEITCIMFIIDYHSVVFCINNYQTFTHRLSKETMNLNIYNLII